MKKLIWFNRRFGRFILQPSPCLMLIRMKFSEQTSLSNFVGGSLTSLGHLLHKTESFTARLASSSVNLRDENPDLISFLAWGLARYLGAELGG